MVAFVFVLLGASSTAAATGESPAFVEESGINFTATGDTKRVDINGVHVANYSVDIYTDRTPDIVWSATQMSDRVRFHDGNGRFESWMWFTKQPLGLKYGLNFSSPVRQDIHVRFNWDWSDDVSVSQVNPYEVTVSHPSLSGGYTLSYRDMDNPDAIAVDERYAWANFSDAKEISIDPTFSNEPHRGRAVIEADDGTGGVYGIHVEPVDSSGDCTESVSDNPDDADNNDGWNYGVNGSSITLCAAWSEDNAATIEDPEEAWVQIRVPQHGTASPGDTIGSTWKIDLNSQGDDTDTAGDRVRTFHFDSDPLDESFDASNPRWGAVSIWANFSDDASDSANADTWTCNSEGETGDQPGASGECIGADGYIRNNATVTNLTLSNQGFQGSQPDPWAYNDDVFATASFIGQGFQETENGEGDAYTMNLSIGDSGAALLTQDNTTADRVLTPETLTWNFTTEGNRIERQFDIGADNVTIEWEDNGIMGTGDEEYVFNVTGHQDIGPGFGVELDSTQKVLAENLTGRIDPRVNFSTGGVTADQELSTNFSGSNEVYNRGETVNYTTFILNQRGERITEDVTFRVWNQQDELEDERTLTGPRYDGLYTIATDDQAESNFVGSPKFVNLTGSNIPRIRSNPNQWNVSSRYQFVSDIDHFETLMHGDTQRVNATFHNARGARVKDGTNVTVKIRNPSDQVVYQATRDTAGNVTANFDQILGSDDAEGTWDVVWNVTASDVGNNNNSVPDTVGEGFKLFNNITNSTTIEIGLRDGNAVLDHFNRGQFVNISGHLDHADGGALRRKTPTGTERRNITVQLYNNSYAVDFQENHTVFVDQNTGWFTAQFNLSTVRGDLNDTYTSTDPNQSEVRSYDVRFYSNTSSESSAVDGNDGNVTDLFDIDTDLYPFGTKTNDSIFNLNDPVQVNMSLFTVQNQSYSNKGSVTVEIRDKPSGVEDSQQVSTDDNGHISYNYIIGIGDDALYQVTQGAEKELFAKDDGNSISFKPDIHNVSSRYFANVHVEIDSNRHPANSQFTFPSENSTGEVAEAIIAADVARTWVQVLDVHNNTVANAPVTTTYIRPDGTEAEDRQLTTGTDGWTTDNHDFSLEAPAGEWTKLANGSLNGNNFTDNDTMTYVSPYTGDLSISISFLPVEGDLKWTFAPGNTVKVITQVTQLEDGTPEPVDMDNNNTQLTVFAATTGNRTCVDKESMDWTGTGVYAYNITLNQSCGFYGLNQSYIAHVDGVLQSRDVQVSEWFRVTENPNLNTIVGGVNPTNHPEKFPAVGDNLTMGARFHENADPEPVDEPIEFRIARFHNVNGEALFWNQSSGNFESPSEANEGKYFYNLSAIPTEKFTYTKEISTDGWTADQYFFQFRSTANGSVHLTREEQQILDRHREEVDPISQLHCSDRKQAGETVYCSFTSQFLNGTFANAYTFDYLVHDTQQNRGFFGSVTNTGFLGRYRFSFTPSEPDTYRVTINNSVQGYADIETVQVANRGLTDRQNTTLFDIDDDINASELRITVNITNEASQIQNSLDSVNASLFDKIVAEHTATQLNLTQEASGVEATVSSEHSTTRTDISDTNATLFHDLNTESASIQLNVTEEANMVQVEVRDQANLTRGNLSAVNSSVIRRVVNEHVETRINVSNRVGDALSSIQVNVTQETNAVQTTVLDVNATLFSKITAESDNVQINITQEANAVESTVSSEHSTTRTDISNINETIFNKVFSEAEQVRLNITRTADNVTINVTQEIGQTQDELGRVNTTLFDKIFDEAELTRINTSNGEALTRTDLSNTNQSLFTHITDESGSIQLNLTKEADGVEATVTSEHGTTRLNATKEASGVEATVTTEHGTTRNDIDSVNTTLFDEINIEHITTRQNATVEANAVQLTVETEHDLTRGNVTAVNQTIYDQVNQVVAEVWNETLAPYTRTGSAAQIILGIRSNQTTFLPELNQTTTSTQDTVEYLNNTRWGNFSYSHPQQTVLTFQGRVTTGDDQQMQTGSINISISRHGSTVWGPYSYNNTIDDGVFNILLGSSHQLELVPRQVYNVTYNVANGSTMDCAQFSCSGPYNSQVVP